METSLIKTLHPLELKVLLKFGSSANPARLDAALLAAELGYKEGQANQAFSWLVGKKLAQEVERKAQTLFEVTQLGLGFAARDLADEAILKLLKREGALSLPEIASKLGLEAKDVGTSFGQLSKEGLVQLDAEKKASLSGQAASVTHIEDAFSVRLKTIRLLILRASKVEGGLLDEHDLTIDERAIITGIARKRGAADALFRVLERERVFYALTAEAQALVPELKKLGITGEELGSVTSEILSKGSWKNASFRPYAVDGPTTRLIPGRRNAYVQFLESVKDKLCSLGFEEFDGNMIQTEFWNSDALFMPQFHAARDIHDVYHIANPEYARSIEEPYLTNVAKTHETGGHTASRGWEYSFDRDFTRRLILRSQGTVLSARQLPTAKVPGRYFGIARCFRYDKVDATHLSDFYQTEGIVLSEEANLSTLLGFLEIFAVEVAGATEVKYVPGYFPFTEPSVEVHIKHPVLGWFELGGAGIFRPEVTEPLGVKVPVLAWGLGVDRMALMTLGLTDVRELFSPDIDRVRLRRGVV